MSDQVDKLQAANLAEFMENGPRLSYAYSTWIVARDPERGRILIGGLGGLGVGQMWRAERDGDSERPGYADALLRTSPSGPFG
jgi:hypothetical protein